MMKYLASCKTPFQLLAVSAKRLGAGGESVMSAWRRNNPEKARAQQRKDEAKKRERRLIAGGRTETQTKCVECGAVYDRMDAQTRGYRILKGNRGYNCVCDECSSPKLEAHEDE